MKPWEYRAVAAYHRLTGSQQYYIDGMQARAAKEGAPPDALFVRWETGQWITLRDLRAQGDQHLVHKIERAVEAADLVRGLGTNER